jgi:hypothetical protein
MRFTRRFVLAALNAPAETKDLYRGGLPAGSAGAAAIFTGHVRPSHIIRRVLLRQIAITNKSIRSRGR